MYQVQEEIRTTVAEESVNCGEICSKTLISFLANNFKQFSEGVVWPSDMDASGGVSFYDVCQ